VNVIDQPLSLRHPGAEPGGIALLADVARHIFVQAV
jgi:hypothetical protein